MRSFDIDKYLLLGT